jgi:hypothetical protein
MLRNKQRRVGMQQPQLTTYADITEVRTVTGAATCNQLLGTSDVPCSRLGVVGSLSADHGWGHDPKGSW